jgi:hypothetical protein
MCASHHGVDAGIEADFEAGVEAVFEAVFEAGVADEGAWGSS